MSGYARRKSRLDHGRKSGPRIARHLNGILSLQGETNA
jgi:hypothetical protein